MVQHAVVNPADTGRRRMLLPFIRVVVLVALGIQVFGGTATAQNAQGAQAGSRPLGRVENLQFETPEPGVVRIFYDLLTDNPLLRFDVTLQVSRDGGQAYDLIATTVTGDVGQGVQPGVGKQIDWDAAQDVERVVAQQFRYRVIVETGPALVVQSTPTGADVSIDGTPRGQTPLSLDDLSPGSHRVTIARSGYLENRQTVSLLTNTAQTLEVTLTADRAAGTTPPPAESAGGVATQPVADSGGGPNLPLILAAVGGGIAAALVLSGGGDGDDPPNGNGQCTYSVSPLTSSVSAAGDTLSVNVSTRSDCTWTATDNVSWITITGGNTAAGNGTVTYRVDANSGTSSRTGTLTIAGRSVTVTQAGPSNHAPVINSIGVDPPSGISTLTSHRLTSRATDADGDQLSYSWDFGNGATGQGANPSVTYTNRDTIRYQATLTVEDPGGLSTSRTVSVTSVTMSGSWSGSLPLAGGAEPMSFVMTQTAGGVVTGTWDAVVFSGEIGPAGAPGMIREDGRFELRLKVLQGSFDDFFYSGTIDPTGQTLDGQLSESGFAGESVVMTKTN